MSVTSSTFQFHEVDSQQKPILNLISTPSHVRTTNQFTSKNAKLESIKYFQRMQFLRQFGNSKLPNAATNTCILPNSCSTEAFQYNNFYHNNFSQLKPPALVPTRGSPLSAVDEHTIAISQNRRLSKREKRKNRENKKLEKLKLIEEQVHQELDIQPQPLENRLHCSSSHTFSKFQTIEQLGSMTLDRHTFKSNSNGHDNSGTLKISNNLAPPHGIYSSKTTQLASSNSNNSNENGISHSHSNSSNRSGSSGNGTGTSSKNNSLNSSGSDENNLRFGFLREFIIF